jgi:MFS family permease
VSGIIKISVPNFSRSKLFVTSIMLNATGGGLMMAFLMVYFSRTTTISLAKIGLSIAIGRALSSVVPILIGRMLDIIGPRKISIIGDMISGIGFILCIFARDPTTIIITQFFTQAGSHIFWTCNRGLVSLASKGDGTQIWFGLVASIRNVGLGFGTVISSLAFTGNSTEILHYVILTSSLLYFLSCFVLFIWRPEEQANVKSNQESRALRSITYKEVWADQRYRGILVINFGLVLSAMVIPLVIVIYATEQLGLTALFSGGLVILNTAIVAIFSTHVASWTKSHNPIKNIKKSYLLNILSFALFWLAGFLVGFNIITYIILVVAMIIYSVAEMIASPAANVLSIDLAPEHNHGNYMAAFQMTWSIGMTITPAIFGWLMDVNKHLTWSVLIASTIVFAFYGFKFFKRNINEYSS